MDTKRIHLIDSLRGFSLLGILLANLLAFQYGIVGLEGLEKRLSQLDQLSLRFIQIVIEGSFMPIFGVLFGYSLIQLIRSIKKREERPKWYLVRRATGLIGLGLLHGYFLWEGDILFAYGTILLLLIFFRRLSAKMLIIVGIIIFFLFLVPLYGDISTSTEQLQEREQYLAQANQVMRYGAFAEIFYFRHTTISPGFGTPVMMLYLSMFATIYYLPIFLIGMAMAKRRFFREPEEERKQYVIGTLLVPIGLLLKTLSSLKIVPDEWIDLLRFSGGPLLAIGYIFLFALLYSKFSKQKIFHLFASVGKLSLTNYLLQTVICTLIFYGYGLGYYGKLGVFVGIFIGLGIYAIQCICSYLYLKKCSRGPFERLLRMWTNWSLDGKVHSSRIKSRAEKEVS